MKIIFYIPGMSFDQDTIDGDKSLGGSETIGYYIAKGMAKKHNVTVFSNIPKPKVKDGLTFMPIGQASKETPYGSAFTDYATKVPHDVMIAQRAAGVFDLPINAKLKYFWTHDLALARHGGGINKMRWNTDRHLCVSNFHKKQYEAVYKIKDSLVSVLPNGIDLELYKGIDKDTKWNSKTIVYSQRPERGLNEFVKKGGIMEEIWEEDREIKLIVCSYEHHVPQMEEYYKSLYIMASKLPNVQIVGALSKTKLSMLMKSAWLHVYPNLAIDGELFEETSCITAMEEQASGTPFITTASGALPETLKDAGVLFRTIEGDDFAKCILHLSKDKKHWEELHIQALNKSKEYSYLNSVKTLDNLIKKDFTDKTKDKTKLFRHLIYNSDILAARELSKQAKIPKKELEIFNKFQLGDNGKFDTNKDYYEYVVQYELKINKNKEYSHEIGNHNYHRNMPRLIPVFQVLSTLPRGSTVLDYGCCIGQATVAYAHFFPGINFVGMDISKRQIEIARKYVKEHKIKNVSYMDGTNPSDAGKFDLVVATEVLEHVLEPVKLLNQLDKAGKQVLISTPYGAHEALSFKHHDIRQHLSHFEQDDLQEMLGNKKDFDLQYIHQRILEDYTPLGFFIAYWKSDGKQIKKFDLKRKLSNQNPRESCSACIITRDNSDTIRETLNSLSFCEQIIIGVDGDIELLKERIKGIDAEVFKIPSPLDIGFDGARNLTIEKASYEWVIWVDDDESFKWPERFAKYLRNGEFDSMAIPQHHFTAEPAGLLKTDLPCRVFRADKSIKFWGLVHEHPETEINKGAGSTMLIPETQGCICHNGYDTEVTRRRRFERNWPLMVKDHKKYPERNLGKMLWIRDLAHINRYEFEQTKQVSVSMKERAQEGLDLWRGMFKKENLRLIVDALPYIKELVELKTNGKGFHFKNSFGLNYMGMGDNLNQNQDFVGVVERLDDIKKINDLIFEDKTQHFQDLRYL